MSHSGPWAKANRGEEEIPKTVLSFSHRLVLLYFPHLQGPSLFFCPHPPGAQSALLLQPFFPRDGRAALHASPRGNWDHLTQTSSLK